MAERLTNKKVAAGLLMSTSILLLLALIMEPKLQAKWQAEQLAAVVASVEQSAIDKPKELSDIRLEAKSAIVYDVHNRRVLYSKNPNTPMPLASLTKLITALVANRVLSPASKVLISAEALQTEGDSGLLANDVWLEKDLSDYMLTVSSNDAAAVFASEVMSREQFILEMNKQVDQMGLDTIEVRNESGLDLDEGTPGAHGSARDIALLLGYMSVVDPELLEATAIEEFMSISDTGKLYKTVNTNKVVNQIPGIIGGKTGYTDLAGGNLAVVFDKGLGNYIVVVVLGSSKDGRFSDVLKLVDAVLSD
jgi:D-alanyl-D-alanine carboxypeptidase